MPLEPGGALAADLSNQCILSYYYFLILELAVQN
jgi:hypothetical protein